MEGLVPFRKIVFRAFQACLLHFIAPAKCLVVLNRDKLRVIVHNVLDVLVFRILFEVIELELPQKRLETQASAPEYPKQK